MLTIIEPVEEETYGDKADVLCLGALVVEEGAMEGGERVPGEDR